MIYIAASPSADTTDKASELSSSERAMKHILAASQQD